MSGKNENTLSRRGFLRNLAIGTLGAGVATLPGCSHLLQQASQKKMNVLFIPVDDLNTTLNCYGASHIHSPNIDRLASEGLLFKRTYCQLAVCGPSRTSLLTGTRPENNGVMDLKTHFRDTLGDEVITLPQQFKNHGYYTRSFSKVFHPTKDDPRSWSEESWWSQYPDKFNYRVPEIDDVLNAEFAQFISDNAQELKDLPEEEQFNRFRRKFRGPSWGAPEVEDDQLADGECAVEVIKALETVGDKPFFFAAGLRKPHLPWVAPKKYYDLYPLESIKLPDNQSMPTDAPEAAGFNWGELRKYRDIPQEGPVSDEQARELIRAYYACISYIDAQLGKMLDALESQGLRDNTMVILWGDHGYHLLEHGIWCKHTNFEESAQSPMIISVPGMKSAGQTTMALTEFVDIYPTLCDLAGIPKPKHIEGSSYKPLLDNPEMEWKSAAFTVYPRKIKGVGVVMGISMRTARYRYCEWRNDEAGYLERELYDHTNDPGENVNIANLPDNKTLVEKLAAMLNAGWRGAVPS